MNVRIKTALPYSIKVVGVVIVIDSEQVGDARTLFKYCMGVTV